MREREGKFRERKKLRKKGFERMRVRGRERPISISDFEGQNAELNPGEISKSDCSRFQS